MVGKYSVKNWQKCMQNLNKIHWKTIQVQTLMDQTLMDRQADGWTIREKNILPHHLSCGMGIKNESQP